LLNLMGKTPRDALTADPVALRWIPVLVGAVYGRQPNVEHQMHLEIGGVFPDPDWMHPDEYTAWLKKLTAMIPEVAEARLLLRQYLDEAIAEAAQQFKDILRLKQSRRAVALPRARIDLTVDGRAILNYRLGTDRTFQGTMRRLDAMQRPKGTRCLKTSAATAELGEEEARVEPSDQGVGAVTTETGEAVGGRHPCTDSAATVANKPESEPEAVFLTTEAKPAATPPEPAAVFLTTEAKPAVSAPPASAATQSTVGQSQTELAPDQAVPKRE
jgi:hypothetical protein